jgi:hypothetical protein
MAHRFYAKNRGETEFQIVEGASTNTKTFELNIDLSAFAADQQGVALEASIFLDELKDYLMGKSSSAN